MNQKVKKTISIIALVFMGIFVIGLTVSWAVDGALAASKMVQVLENGIPKVDSNGDPVMERIWVLVTLNLFSIPEQILMMV